MFIRNFLVVLYLSAVCFPASAEYYQCENKWGKKVFSDKPCGKEEKKFTIKKPVTYESENSSDKWKGIISSNKVRDMEREIDKRNKKIFRYRKRRDSEMKVLRNKKAMAANNLAGANWEVSLSKEMDVVQAKYRGLIESEEREIDHLRNKIFTQDNSRE